MISFGVLMRHTWHNAERCDWFTRGTLLGIAGSIIAFAAASFVHYNLGDGEVIVVYSRQ